MNANSPGLPTAATVDILNTLVGFNTISHQSNLGLIEWARDYLARLGVKSRLSYDADKRKANLFCTLGEGRLPGDQTADFSGERLAPANSGESGDQAAESFFSWAFRRETLREPVFL